MKLPNALKRQWVKALRSGKFKQTSGSLKDSGGYCCLGVLCELKGRLGTDKSLMIDYDITDSSVKAPKIRGGQLLHPLSSWVLPSWIDRKTQSELANMNDNGKSFAQIATWIEKNL